MKLFKVDSPLFDIAVHCFTVLFFVCLFVWFFSTTNCLRLKTLSAHALNIYIVVVFYFCLVQINPEGSGAGPGPGPPAGSGAGIPSASAGNVSVSICHVSVCGSADWTVQPNYRQTPWHGGGRLHGLLFRKKT